MNLTWFSRERVRACVQLLNPAVLLIAVVDALAGYLVIFGPEFNTMHFAGIAACAAAIQAGHSVARDLLQRENDSYYLTHPLISGHISKKTEIFLTWNLLGTGLFIAAWLGWRTLLIAFFLAVALMAYDLFTRDMDLAGPFHRGGCRALTMFLGMSPGLPLVHLSLIFPLISLIYTFSIATFERLESQPKGRWNVLAGWSFVIFAVLFLRINELVLEEGIVFLAAFALVTAPAVSWKFKPSSPRFATMGKTLLIGIPLLNSVFLAGIHGWPYGLLLALFIIPLGKLCHHS